MITLQRSKLLIQTILLIYLQYISFMFFELHLHPVYFKIQLKSSRSNDQGNCQPLMTSQFLVSYLKSTMKEGKGEKKAFKGDTKERQTVCSEP